MEENGQKVTIREVYRLLEDTKHELHDEIKEVKDAFMTLEAGRLTALEHDFTRFKTQITTLGSTGLILLGVIQFIVGRYF